MFFTIMYFSSSLEPRRIRRYRHAEYHYQSFRNQEVIEIWLQCQHERIAKKDSMWYVDHMQSDKRGAYVNTCTPGLVIKVGENLRGLGHPC